MPNPRVVLAGGSGFLGHALARDFLARGYEVVVLTRAPAAARGPLTQVTWDGRTLGAWAEHLEGAAVLVNLAGKSVNCRYTAENRRAIFESRLQSTRILGAAIARASRPPRLWLQSSTATIYAHRYDAPNDEATGVLGGAEEHAPDTWRFSIDVATGWERVANAALVPHTRKVLLRTAVVMGPYHGGAFEILLRLVRWGLGGRTGDGRQFVSWLHEQDFIRAVHWLIEHEALEGPVNLAAPHPVPNAEFMSTLRAAWGIRIGLPAAEWMLEIGAFFLRTESELILKSRRVVPGRLLQTGFPFQFPTWEEAAGDLCRRWRDLRRGMQHPAVLPNQAQKELRT